MKKLDFVKISEFYDIIEKHKTLYVKKKSEGSGVYIPKTDLTLYFLFGHSSKNTEETEKLVNEGKAVKTTGIEFYSQYYGWSDEEACLQRNNYDLRTKKYLEAIKHNIGLLDEKHGYDEEQMEEFEEIDVFLNTNKVRIGKAQNGRWVAQYGLRTDIDDYDITRFYFNRKPTKDAILTAQQLTDINLYFRLGEIRYKFSCWECGLETHWLDCRGAFSDKYNAVRERYCGC